jgi:3-hydroxy-3-methylglutaryl CoA synthase
MELYLKALGECYLKLKEKNKGQSPVEGMNYFCFHSPFAKMVQKAFESLLKTNNSTISSE